MFSYARVMVIGVGGDFKPPVALAALHSTAVFLLLLTRCLLLLPLFVGGSVFGPCFVMYTIVHSVISSFAIILMGK